jgi:hypothetical protein
VEVCGSRWFIIIHSSSRGAAQADEDDLLVKRREENEVPWVNASFTGFDPVRLQCGKNP